MLYNFITREKARVKSNKSTSVNEIEKLLEIVQGHLKPEETYVWDANLNGIVVRYTGNSFHQCDFWKDNWWPAPARKEPEAFIYSAYGIEGMEPMAYYCPERNTSIFINTEYYG